MVQLFSTLFLFFALTATVGIAEEESKETAEEPEPFDQDEYSGRPVSTFQDRYEIVRSRFFNAPRYGTKAPSFTLENLESSKPVSLSELHQDKPVVLIFGSIGCDVLRDGFSEVMKAYEAHRDQFTFVLVYIREAHSTDSPETAELARVKDPVTFLERRLAARTCKSMLEVPFPILVDTIDDRTATRWAAWPVRAFVVDRDGTVVYAGRPGPWGFHPGGEFKPELSDQLRPHADRFNQESLQEFLAGYQVE